MLIYFITLTPQMPSLCFDFLRMSVFRRHARHTFNIILHATPVCSYFIDTPRHATAAISMLLSGHHFEYASITSFSAPTVTLEPDHVTKIISSFRLRQAFIIVLN